MQHLAQSIAFYSLTELLAWPKTWAPYFRGVVFQHVQNMRRVYQILYTVNSMFIISISIQYFNTDLNIYIYQLVFVCRLLSCLTGNFLIFFLKSELTPEGWGSLSNTSKYTNR